MMELKTFPNEVFGDLRVVEIDGEPWFVARDAVLALGYTNPTESVRMYCQNPIAAKGQRISSLHPQTKLIPESDLYRLVMRSKLPGAERFQDWVTKVVLPAIRKDGAYVMGEEKVVTGEMSEDELILKAMTVMQTKVERLKAENAVMSETLNFVTIDSYRAIHCGEYWSHGKKVRFAYRAKKLCETRGIETDVEVREVFTPAGPKETVVKVYPKYVLDEVYQQLKDCEV